MFPGIWSLASFSAQKKKNDNNIECINYDNLNDLVTQFSAFESYRMAKISETSIRAVYVFSLRVRTVQSIFGRRFPSCNKIFFSKASL